MDPASGTAAARRPVSREMNDYRALLLRPWVEAAPHDDGNRREEVSFARPRGLRNIWASDVQQESNMFLVTYATSLQDIAGFYFYAAATKSKDEPGRKLLLVPNVNRAAYWQSLIAEIDAREAQHPELTIVTPEGLSTPLIAHTSLLLVDGVHLVLGLHGDSSEHCAAGASARNLSETVEFADAITRLLFYHPGKLRVFAQMAGPSSARAQRELVPLLAQWLRCSSVRHIIPQTPTPEPSAALERGAHHWPYTIIPFAVPVEHQLDHVIDQRREYLYEVLEAHTGVFDGKEQALVLCPTKRSTERTLAALASRLAPQGAACTAPVPSLILSNVPEDSRIKLETLGSLLRNTEAQRRALLGIGTLEPDAGDEESSAWSSASKPAAHSDRVLLQELFRSGALRIAAMAIRSVRGRNDKPEGPDVAASAGRGARKSPPTTMQCADTAHAVQPFATIEYVTRILDEMHRSKHAVVVVLKTTHWSGYHGEPKSFQASVLRALSRCIFRVAVEPTGVLDRTRHSQAAIMHVTCQALHRLMVFTSQRSAPWVYLHATGRLFTGDNLPVGERAAEHEVGTSAWWIQHVARTASQGLSFRLLREMNCCGTPLVDEAAAAEWMRYTLHAALMHRGQRTEQASRRGPDAHARALVRLLENAGCIQMSAPARTYALTMLGLAALKYQISPESILGFIRSAYGKPRCLGTFSSDNAAEHRHCIGIAAPRPTARIVFDPHRHQPRCRAVIELLYYVCHAGAERELRDADMVLHQIRDRGLRPEQAIPFTLHEMNPARLQKGEAVFLVAQLWMATAEPPHARTIFEAVLAMVHCLCAAISERPALYRQSIIATLASWMEKFRNGAHHWVRAPSDTPRALLEQCLIAWTRYTHAPKDADAR